MEQNNAEPEKEQQESLEIDKDKIDYESLGKWLRRIRKKHGLTQEEVASQYFHVSRTVYLKYEKGTVRLPDWQCVEDFAKAFNENPEELKKKISVAIPDTCALMKNKRLLHMLLEDYNEVVIPTTVITELMFRKNHALLDRDRRAAWQMMANIDYYATEYADRFKRVDNEGYRIPEEVRATGDQRIINDYRVMQLAGELGKKTIGDVEIITDDVDITSKFPKAVKLNDYVIRRNRTTDYEEILDLDQEYTEFRFYEKELKHLDLNAYLPDGMTLLISCIRCRTKDKSEQLGRQVPESAKYRKLTWLIEHGADINKNDNSRYCLPPLAHCVQIDDWKAFHMLLDAGADFNKASRDETTASYMKVGKLNEGNTPLMIACWAGKKKYAEKLCGLPGISLNQQDSNGYTALIKCAVQRYHRLQSGKPVVVNEHLYHLLLERGADPLIRDRNNRTAKDWWEMGDALLQEGKTR